MGVAKENLDPVSHHIGIAIEDDDEDNGKSLTTSV